MELPADEGARLILHAAEKEDEQVAWEAWVHFAPHMDPQIPFDEFYRRLKEKTMQAYQKPLSAAEVIAKAERIRKADQGRG